MEDQDALLSPETAAQRDQKKRDAKRRLWNSGNLSWKFQEFPWCKRFYEFVRSNWGEFLFLTAHRRSGKSTTGLIIAIEECIRNPNIRVAVICTTRDQARSICEDSIAQLILDCPQSCKPKQIKNSWAFAFPNGSRIDIMPADGVKSRGRKFRFILITEAAFIPKLDKLIKSKLAPTLRDVKGEWRGTLLAESTPPDEDVGAWDAEEFERLFTEAELEGRSLTFPLSENKLADPGFVEECINDSGGRESIYFQREYQCKFVKEKNRTAIPEATQERLFQGDATKLTQDRLFGGDTTKALPPIVREVPRPLGADRYVSLDPGGSHMTALLFGFYDFENDLLCIEDEVTFDNVTSDILAVRVRAKELELWGSSSRGKLYRYADNNNQILLYDLFKEHRLTFQATAKDQKDAQINRIRLMVRDGQLAIHPRCRVLIKTLRLAKRAKQERKGFEESNEIGHADLLDALIYLARNLKRHDLPDSPVRRMAERDLPRIEKASAPSKGVAQFAKFLTRRR